jgi:hypothetical protein
MKKENYSERLTIARFLASIESSLGVQAAIQAQQVLELLAADGFEIEVQDASTNPNAITALPDEVWTEKRGFIKCVTIVGRAESSELVVEVIRRKNAGYGYVIGAPNQTFTYQTIFDCWEECDWENLKIALAGEISPDEKSEDELDPEEIARTKQLETIAFHAAWMAALKWTGDDPFAKVFREVREHFKGSEADLLNWIMNDLSNEWQPALNQPRQNGS